jgi:hypothetical protein
VTGASSPSPRSSPAGSTEQLPNHLTFGKQNGSPKPADRGHHSPRLSHRMRKAMSAMNVAKKAFAD